ncbi:MAG: undecaprenyl-diphosphate phosphatase [Bacteroidetes bacterium]|nr:undecaprenyl-diphosphate phosphatase [Bacteroidota bacterium]
MTWLEAVLIAIVEGITEFLPISSTGHMIITEELLGVEHTAFTKLFTVGIQLGAIAAVVILYWKRFFLPLRNGTEAWQFYGKLLLAVAPALVSGFFLAEWIDLMLENSWTVGVTLILGGFVLLFIDGVFKDGQINDEKKIQFTQALWIGCWQCLALIPGVSRSAASIIGGMQQKLTRALAAEFSFFLAVPTMVAATGYKFLKGYDQLQPEHLTLFLLGNVVAFVVAILTITLFIGFLQRKGFRFFGYYRIVVGSLLLIALATGIVG